MAWMQCRGCSAKFAVGLLRCPQCTAVSELYAVPEEVIEAEQEASMPKITVGGGASNAAETVEPEPVPVETETAPEAAVETEPAAPVADAVPERAESEVAATPKPAAKRAAAKKTAAAPEPAAGK